MRKYIKAGMLTLVLVMPALVILFLHGFAENHFELPYLAPLTDSSGRVQLKGKDTVFYQVPIDNQDKIRVVSFLGDTGHNQARGQLSRVEKLVSNEVFIEKLSPNESEVAQKYRVSSIKKGKPAKTILYNEQFVLIDKKGFIRGYYDGTDPVDVDRLITEIEILLDIYRKQNN
jgi:protein SCO1